MVDTENVHTSINNALINTEKLKTLLVKIEQEFTDDNYPNWKFNVELCGKLSGNPVCCVNGETIEKGLNCTSKIEIQFRFCKQKPTVNLNYAYLSFNCDDIEYLKTMEQILNMPNVPFELTRVICKILAETKHENLVTKGTKELNIALKKLDLNKDFENG